MRQTLDQALDERNRLLRNYNKQKKAELLELCKDELYGERLWKLVATLNHFNCTIDNGDRMIEYVERENKKWLGAAPVEFRYAALSAIDDRCVKIRERAGLAPFEDPMPWQDNNVFFACKEVLGL